MQLDPQILRESPNLEEVQKNFSDISSGNTPFSAPKSPIQPTPPSEDPVEKFIRQANAKAQGTQTPYFSVQTSELPGSSRYPFVLPGTNYEELYAQGQGNVSKWTNALIKMAGITGTTFLQGTLGTINGVVRASQDGKLSSFYDNEFSRSLDDFNRQMEDQFPNYYTQAEQNASIPSSLLTANFWADKVVKNLGYAAGAIGSGAAWTKVLQASRIFSAISASGKMAEAAAATESAMLTVPQAEKLNAGISTLQNIAQSVNRTSVALDRTQRFITAGMGALSESAMEALQSSTEFKNSRINEYVQQYGKQPEGEDLQRIQREADNAGNTTLLLNTALLTASNYIQFPKILKSNFNVEKSIYNNGIKETENIIFDQAAGKYIKEVPKTTIGKFLKGAKNVTSYLFAPSEAFEEGAQAAIQVGTEDYFNKKYRGNQVDFFSSLGEGVRSTLTTKEGLESILIGGLSGAISQARNTIVENRQIRRDTTQAIDAFNSTSFTGYMKDKIDGFNRSLTLQEQRADAIKRGDKFDANDLENDYLHNYLVPRVKYGRLDLVIDDINTYKTLASTADGINQLQQEDMIPEGMDSTQFLQKLQETENYAKGMNELYKSLNIRYSGIQNEDKSRKYSDDVIDRMVYASSKISFYDKILPDLTSPLLLAGINVQPIIDSLENNNRPSTEAVETAVNQINNLNTLSDVKEDLKSNLRDSLEVILRRKKFLKDYEAIKKNPERYQDAQFGIDDLFDQGPVTIPQEEGDIEVSQNQETPLTSTVTREGNKISLFPSLNVIGKTTLGELQIRLPNGEIDILTPEEAGTFSLNPNFTAKQREDLENRYKIAVDAVVTKEEYAQFDIPVTSLDATIEAVNQLDNEQLTNEVEQALNAANEQYQADQAQIEALLKDKEKLKEIDKQFEDEEKESAEVPTNDPAEDNKIIEKENKGLGGSKEVRENNQRKPLDILFESTTSPNYEVETPNDNFHRRANKFLNNIDTFPDRDDIEVLLVTRNNQDELGLTGLIPAKVPGEENTPSTDVQNGIIQAVFVKGDEFLDVNGQPLSKIGETPDLDKLVYQTLPNTSLKDREGNNRYIDAGSKGSSKEDAEEAQEEWEERRDEIFAASQPLRYKFTVSRGALNSPKDSTRQSPVGPIITQEMLNKRVIYIPMQGVKQTATVAVAEVPMNGITYYFPVGRPLLKTGSILQQLNNRKFTQEEKENLKNVISNLPNEDGTVNQDLLSFLKDILYVRTPTNKVSKNQLWFEDGYLFLGSKDVSVPFTKAALSASTEVDDFLNANHFNINANTLIKNNQFREIIGFENNEPKYVRWKSYQHYLLSPTYDITEVGDLGLRGSTRTNTPLYLNLPNPEDTSDPYQAPFLRKYITLKNFEIPEEVTESEIIPTANETEDERIPPSSSIDGIGIVESLPYSKVSINDFKPENQLKFSQGTSFEPVHVVGSAELLRYYALAARAQSQQKDQFKGRLLTENELAELSALKEKYGPGVVEKIKTLAKQSRSADTARIIIIGTTASEEEFEEPGSGSIENEGDLFMQISQDVPSPASSQTLAKLDVFLSNVGVSVQRMQQITLNGQSLQASGLADPINKLIQVVQGKEDVALPEEAMHIAVDLIEQQDPTLFNQMLNRIGTYDLYNKVLEQYRSNPFYQKEGKPDIRKIKKEAIGKVLAETVIRQNEGTTENPQRLNQTKSWWEKIVDFLRSIFNFPNPFEQSASLVLNNQILAGPLPTEDSVYLQIDPSQGEAYARISANKTIPSNAKPASDVVTEVLDKLYRSKKISKEQYDQLVDQEKRFKNDTGHNELSNIFKRLIDDTGLLRENETVNKETTLEDPEYDILFNNIKERLQTFPKGTRFLTSHTIYDQKSNEQATPDLIAIRPDGTVNLYDFRFLELAEGAQSIPNEIRQVSQTVLDNYQSILVNGYNIPVNVFGQKRTIPVIITKNGDSITSLEIGQVTEKEKNNLLTPIVSGTESTGNKKVDALIERINGLIQKLLETRAETGQENVKYTQIGNLISSVRNIQLYNSGSKFVKTAQKDVRRIEKHFAPYLKILKSGTQEQKDALKLEDLSSEILLARDILDLYKDTVDLYVTDFSGTPALEGNQYQAEKTAGEAARVRNELVQLSNKLRTDVLARGVGIRDFLKPEKVIGWWSNYVRSLSQSPTKAGQILWKIVNKMTNQAAIEYDQEFKKLQSIGDSLSIYAKSKGTTVDAQFKKLLQIDAKGRWKNGQLISKISDEFYTDAKNALKEKDINWIKENIDVDAYKTWYQSALKDIEDNNEVARYDEDDQKDAEIKERRVQNFIDKYGIDNLTDSSELNKKILDFPVQSKWESKEYAEIKGEKPLLDFYNYMVERNSLAHDLGMLKTWEFKNFVPNIRKGLTDSAVFGVVPKGNKSANLNVLNSVRVDVNDNSFGNIDPLTGKNEDSLFAMYLYDLGENITTADGEIYTDYSAKSADLLRSFSLFNDQLIKYKYAKEVENTVKLLQFTEEERTATLTSKTGGIVFKSKSTVPVTVPNIENSKYLKSFIDYYFYGKKLQGGGDATFTINYNKIANSVNSVIDILPVSPQDNITLSGKKALQVANRFFSLKVLGLNVASAGANLMGGSANAYISAGRFFTPADMRNSQLRFASGKFWTPEGKKYAALSDYFVSLVDNQVDNTSRELSVNKAVRWLSSDNIMFLQRNSDKAVQLPVAMAFFDNTMVRDGELVNIRDYVKRQNNYDSRFDLSPKEQTALLERIEKEVQALKDTESLSKVVEIEKDQIKIPNGTGGYIERTSTTVSSLRNQIQQYTKDIIGNMTSEDISRYKMNVLLQSFMMFKNWIPRMGEARFSEFRYNVGTDNFEWGRVRMLANAVKHNLRRGALDVIATLGNKNQGVIEIAKQMYQQKKLQIEEEQGIGSFTITEADFIDAYIRGIKSSLKELGMWLALAGIMIASQAVLTDDDDKPVNGAAKGWLRYLDRVSNELSFFYNPASYIELANGNIFPAIGIANDVLNVTGATGAELWYWFTGDQQAKEENKVAKYVFKALPITKELTSYAALFNDEIAKELGIRINTEQRRRG